MNLFLAKVVYTVTHLKFPKVYCCAKCGAEQNRATATHIIFCNSCKDKLFEEIRESNRRTRAFLEEHKDEIAAWQKSEVERLKTKDEH